MRKRINKKIWRRLFFNMAVISVSFTVILAIANGSLFAQYFTHHEKRVLRSCADTAATLDLTQRGVASQSLQRLEDNYNVQINISENDVVVYSTLHQSIRRRTGISGFDMLVNVKEPMQVLSRSSDRYGGVFTNEVTLNSTEYLVYTRDYNGRNVEIMLKQSIIESSTALAVQFVSILAIVGLVAMLVLNIFISLRFTKPITEMNNIAQKMTELDFSRKAEVYSDDEIGELAQSINTLSDSLSASLTELKEKNAILERDLQAQKRLDEMRKGFVASVSHELKTPIAIIQGYAEGLESGVVNDEQTKNKYCGVIKDETDRMNKLVLTLLELSRIESGVDLNPQSFDLSELVVNTIDRNSDAISASGCEFSLDVADRQLVTADRLMMEQVLQNYINNALGHVSENGKISVYTEPYANNIRLCVFNSGEHIPENELESIWQSFHRVDKAHNRASGRVGLGLSIVRAIMIAHKKDFGVFNTNGGVVFWFEIESQKGTDI